MKIDSGKLDLRITIEKPIETLIAGEMAAQSWELHYTTWAMHKQVTNEEQENVEGMQRVSSDMTEFTIRYPMHKAMPNTKMRVVEVAKGFIYDIENVRMMGRNDFLVLVCKQRQQR
jgi:hypothetical protein